MEPTNHHIQLAQILRDYHHMNHELAPVDGIVVFGSHDTRVATVGAQLFLDGYGKYLVFSGGLGRITQDRRKVTEAEKFAQIARDMGVNSSKIYVEPASTNSEQNVTYTMQLLHDKGLSYESLTVVHKPYMERRAFATFKKHYPDQSLHMASQDISMMNYPNNDISLEKLINLLVGDAQRIITYPEKGYQIPQYVPDHVHDAMQQLIAAGYDNELVK